MISLVSIVQGTNATDYQQHLALSHDMFIQLYRNTVNTVRNKTW